MGAETTSDVLDRAAAVAASLQDRAGVRIVATEQMTDLRAASALFAEAWGRTEEGVPLHGDVMRELTHAGGCTLVARDAHGALVGAACLAVAAPPLQTYGMIAAAAPGATDRGIGHALKAAQRAWALERGYTSMTWTFDPLVARNARFNLVKLGAVAAAYEVAFFGQMADELNRGDDSDRLVAVWSLDSPRAERTPPADPSPQGDVTATGPDGEPLVRVDATERWVRAPRDIVELRRVDPEAADAWRLALRENLGGALADGLVATHVTRSGWYRLGAQEVG